MNFLKNIFSNKKIYIWNIPVIFTVYFQIYILCLIFTSTNFANLKSSLTETAIVFSIVTLHEFGHLAMANFVGLKGVKIELYPFGGLASIEGLGEAGGSEEFSIAIAGPLVNVFLGLLAIPFIGIDYGSHWLAFFLDINFGLIFFNMLPILPLDGGRVARSMLSSLMGKLPATKIVFVFGMIISGAISTLMLFSGAWLMGIFLAIFTFVFGYAEVKRLSNKKKSELNNIQNELESFVSNIGHLSDEEIIKECERLTKLVKSY